VRIFALSINKLCRATASAVVVLLLAAPATAQAGDSAARIAAHAAGASAAAPAPVGDAMPLGRASAASLGAPRPEGASGAAGGGVLLSTAGALGLVVGLVLLSRWVVVKLSGRPVVTTNAAVEVLSRTAVAPKSHVLLLRVGGRVLVVGDAGGALRPLDTIDDPGEVADLLGAVTAARPGSVTQSFGGLLDRFNRDHDAADRRRTEGVDQSEQQAGVTLDALAGLKSGLRSRLKNVGGA